MVRIQPPDSGGEPTTDSLAGISPYLSASEENITFKPAIVTRFGGTLPWNTQRDQTLCGESIVNQNGDLNARITMEGFITLDQLGDLFALRNSSSEVKVRWEGVDATGINSVTFDQLKWDRRDEEDLADYNGQAAPQYSFQLQSKEDSGDN